MVLPAASPRAGLLQRAAPICLLGILALLSLLRPTHAQGMALTYAEAPVQLIRKTTVHDVAALTVLFAGDMVKTAAGSAQIELAGGVLVGIGPDTSLLIVHAAAAPQLVLVRGWIKVQTASHGARPASILTDVMTLAITGSAIVRQTADQRQLLQSARCQRLQQQRHRA